MRKREGKIVKIVIGSEANKMREIKEVGEVKKKKKKCKTKLF